MAFLCFHTYYGECGGKQRVARYVELGSESQYSLQRARGEQKIK
ncbi:uncharacterized protein G2W53_001328 [Senna tora]|uniref:Uncharacterized protein n=1 Tax=Senna tora TaxID=362788 RepID=A0A834XJG9_9FABA|nr:uncharacterized protein G2W53_001328 [Senna tora]